MLNCFITICHILDSFLELKFLLPAFFLESFGLSFLAIESHVDTLYVAANILKLLFEVTNLCFFCLKHLLSVAKLTTRMLDAVVEKFDLFFVLLCLSVFVFNDLF